MECPNCKKVSRCGCGSCKARVKYPINRACKITNLSDNKSIGIVQCPYCRSKFTEDYLSTLEWEQIKTKLIL